MQVFISVPTLSGELQHTVLFRDPIILQHGKTMAALASAAMLCPGLGMSAVGESRVHLRHQVHDRGVSAGLFGLLSGYWASMRTEEDRSFELHTHVGCCAHDAHNALKWAHHAWFGDESLLENLYICAQALRSSFAPRRSGFQGVLASQEVFSCFSKQSLAMSKRRSGFLNPHHD